MPALKNALVNDRADGRLIASRAGSVALPPEMHRRGLRATPVYETYWRFAAERQAVFFRRLECAAELTADWIIRDHRFTNAYRAADRVSQYLIGNVLPGSYRDPRDLVFRILLFKIFNRISTWEHLEAALGPLHWRSYRFERYSSVLTKLFESGERLYSSAYIMPSPAFGHRYKHDNHLALLEFVLRGGLAERLGNARSLSAAYDALLAVPSFGPFLAFQYTIDVNYSDLLRFSENDFVVAGPGALDGIAKCFSSTGGYTAAGIIRMMVEHAEEEFERFDISFSSLWGRPLHQIDCQNLFCEVDKYARIAHPSIHGKSGRQKIKQQYAANNSPIDFVFPERWKLTQQAGPLCLMDRPAV